MWKCHPIVGDKRCCSCFSGGELEHIRHWIKNCLRRVCELSPISTHKIISVVCLGKISLYIFYPQKIFCPCAFESHLRRGAVFAPLIQVENSRWCCAEAVCVKFTFLSSRCGSFCGSQFIFNEILRQTQILSPRMLSNCPLCPLRRSFF